MNLSIRHRGPDGSGELIDHEIGLGHRRLSIIDLDGGAQPMTNETGDLHVIFNGEIYNFIELRRELQQLGHQFKTCSDTEVIVHGYEEWGSACLNRFNGIFGFAIWDSAARTLFCARDRLGVKPFYYTFVGDELVFGSEIKALLRHPGCTKQVDLDALAELFTFRYVPSPKTLFKNINKLPPAHFFTASTEGICVQRYWKWVPQIRPVWKEPELIEEYQSLLDDAVRLQMRSDVPVGLFLSSGVDSGSLLAIMSKYASGPVQAFTIGFEGGEKTDETRDAAALAGMFGAQHHVEMLTPSDYVKYYERYMLDIEEPVGNETAAAFFFLSKVTRERVKVALTGQGADEPWAGYDRYKGVKLSTFYNQLPQIITNGIARLVAKMPGPLERFKRGVASLNERDLLIRFTKVYSFFSVEMKDHLFKDDLRTRLRADPYATRNALTCLQRDVRHLDPLTQMLYIDTRANLPDDLLMVADKTSMANSLEVRVPLLDHRLVEFAESLPSALKLKGLTGKYLHKKAMKKWLPKGVVYRRKKGFANPIEDWFRVGMKAFVKDCLLSSSSSMSRYFDQNYIRQIVDLDQRGTEQYRRHIYLLVSLELWHRAFAMN